MNIMNTLRSTYQRSIHQIRQFHKCIIQQTEVTAAATASTVSVSESVSTENHPAVSSKIEMIANQIVNLNLIEVAQLSDLLKKKLNLPDAPIMPMGGFIANAPNAEVEEEESQVVQTAFTVKLTGFDEKQKIALIKELKSILPDCNLVQAKKFVESTPGVVKADIAKDEAEKLKEAITKVGGTVEIV
ncbi:39S ribosomal protein L12, mitochondrial [Frieseomelitta varia]|uniref:39S ribosomal protein L12, mitochondrial n=1 Tax=Frieseomelitta varia TaxID=561572 RepID=UPI001CB69D38|nr:39S ribosomal protein L12, mitochondrial [Frieseomelitta varia]